MIAVEDSLSNDVVKSIVVSSIERVFATMVSLSPKFESCVDVLQNPNSTEHQTANIDETVVVGNVGFVGDMTGMVYLVMPESTAMEITKRMLHLSIEDIKEDHDMTNDVIGELSNMSAGAIKNQFDAFNCNCRLTIPSIIRGKYFVVESAKATLRHFYRFGCLDKQIGLELLMCPSSENLD